MTITPMTAEAAQFNLETCKHKIDVVATPYGTSHDGTACGYTGGHCRPSEKCREWAAS